MADSKSKIKIVIFEGFWGVDDCLTNPTSLFIFGDNDVKRGVGGQAVIRHCSNSVGISTKKYPNNNADSFYSDDEYKENRKKIKDAIENIKFRVDKEKFKKIVIPKNTIGTGLSKLDTKAPKTFVYLLKQIDKLKKNYES